MARHAAPNDTPLVSILCVTRNRCAHLLRALLSCRQQDYPHLELVIVDNASEDGTVAMIRERFPGAILIRTHKNLGFFPALNLAVANSRGAYLMTVDDDAYFQSSDAISRLVGEFGQNSQLAGLVCNLEGPHERPPIQRDRYVPAYGTGITMLDRRVFDEWIGFYPDIFFRSAGETYIAFGLWDMGRQIKQLADVRMFHDRAVEGRSIWQWEFYGVQSQILVCFMRDPWFWLPFHLAGRFCSGFVHFLRRRRLHVWAAAWTHAWLELGKALKLRRPIRWRTQRLLWRLRSGDEGCAE